MQMESHLCVENHVEGKVDRPATLEPTDLKAKGKFIVEHFRKGEKIGEYEFPNGIVDQGLNSILGIMFHSDTQITTWYIGLIDNSGFSALANADTLASHAGWNEFTNYTGNRKSWSPGSASSRSITNGTTADFAITGTGTLKGIFVSNAASGTSGTLWSTAAFGATVSVSNGDTLKVTYTVSG
jgi:hypothetical protein